MKGMPSSLWKGWNFRSDLPAKAHQLIIAKSRQSPADEQQKPTKEKNLYAVRDNLQYRNKDARQQDLPTAGEVKSVCHEIRNLPSSEKQRRDQRCDQYGLH